VLVPGAGPGAAAAAGGSTAKWVPVTMVTSAPGVTIAGFIPSTAYPVSECRTACAAACCCGVA